MGNTAVRQVCCDGAKDTDDSPEIEEDTESFSQQELAHESSPPVKSVFNEYVEEPQKPSIDDAPFLRGMNKSERRDANIADIRSSLRKLDEQKRSIGGLSSALHDSDRGSIEIWTKIRNSWDPERAESEASERTTAPSQEDDGYTNCFLGELLGAGSCGGDDGNSLVTFDNTLRHVVDAVYIFCRLEEWAAALHSGLLSPSSSVRDQGLDDSELGTSPHLTCLPLTKAAARARSMIDEVIGDPGPLLEGIVVLEVDSRLVSTPLVFRRLSNGYPVAVLHGNLDPSAVVGVYSLARFAEATQGRMEIERVLHAS